MDVNVNDHVAITFTCTSTITGAITSTGPVPEADSPKLTSGSPSAGG